MKHARAALCLPLFLFVLGFAHSGDRQGQSDAFVEPQLEAQTTVQKGAAPHVGLTQAEKAKLSNFVEVSAEESEKARIPNLPQAGRPTLTPQGKRARPVEVEPCVSTTGVQAEPTPRMTPAELEKLQREPVTTSNKDGIDNAGKELVPAEGMPGEAGGVQ